VVVRAVHQHTTRVLKFGSAWLKRIRQFGLSSGNASLFRASSTRRNLLACMEFADGPHGLRSGANRMYERSDLRKLNKNPQRVGTRRY